MLLASVFIFSGCATIVHGSRQSISFASVPGGAKIFIDKKEVGQTPKIISLRRNGKLNGQKAGKKFYDVKLELDGFLPYEMKIIRKGDGWVAGNLLFGGLIGLFIDLADGAVYKLTPEQVTGQMARNTAWRNSDKDAIYIAATLNPDPSWEKVATIERK
jgi:hypothetical protein